MNVSKLIFYEQMYKALIVTQQCLMKRNEHKSHFLSEIFIFTLLFLIASYSFYITTAFRTLLTLQLQMGQRLALDHTLTAHLQQQHIWAMRPCTKTPDLGSEKQIMHRLSVALSFESTTKLSIVSAGSLTVFTRGATSFLDLFRLTVRSMSVWSESESDSALRLRSSLQGCEGWGRES